MGPAPVDPSRYVEPRPRRGDPAVVARVGRPAAYRFLADPARRPAWQASLRRVDVLTDGPPRVGTRWVDHLHAGVRFRLAIVAMDPPRLWAEAGRVGPVTAYVTLLLEPHDGPDGPATRIRVLPRVHATGAARPLGWLGTAVMRTLVRLDLTRLRHRLEQTTGE